MLQRVLRDCAHWTGTVLVLIPFFFFYYFNKSHGCRAGPPAERSELVNVAVVFVFFLAPLGLESVIDKADMSAD